MKPIVSVIVTTRNSAQTLELCLSSIISQTTRDIEIIVVDNNSTDQTIEIAKKYTDRILQHGPERSAQRNLGAKKAQGKYLLFLDSDMELSPHVIEEILAEYEGGAIGIYIPEIIKGNTLWAQIRTFERSFYNGTPIDAVRAVAKEVFTFIGGFDETLTGPEDWDFDKRVRMKGNTSIIHAPLYHHEEAVTLTSFIEKKLYYAKDFTRYREKWGNDDLDIVKQFGFSYRFWGVFTENGKWKNLVKKPHLSIVLYLIRIYLGIRYALSS